MRGCRWVFPLSQIEIQQVQKYQLLWAFALYYCWGIHESLCRNLEGVCLRFSVCELKKERGTQTLIFLAVDPSGEGGVSQPGDQGAKCLSILFGTQGAYTIILPACPAGRRVDQGDQTNLNVLNFHVPFSVLRWPMCPFRAKCAAPIWKKEYLLRRN